jgi:hypothetical protein
MNFLKKNAARTILDWFLPLLAVGALGGCATPQYATQTTFIPPQTAKGLVCIAQCQTELKQCQNTCAAARQSCIANIEPAAQEAFASALKAYEVARKQYEIDRQFYELNRSLHMGFANPVFVPGYGWVMRPGFYHDDYYDDAPTPPVAPSLAEERKRLIHEQCDSAPCPCEENFEQCYVGCGGGVKKSVVCIANCKDSDLRPQPQSPVQSEGGVLQKLTPLKP